MTAQRRPLTMTRGGMIGSLVVLMVALVCVRLGFWQLARLEQKRTRNSGAHARLAEAPLQLISLPRDSAGLLLRRVVVHGEFDDQRTIILAGRSKDGVPGVYVFTPLRVGASAALVNRGWLPSADAATVTVDSMTELGARNLEAIIVPLPDDPRAARDSLSEHRRVWYHMRLPELQRQFPYPLVSYAIQLLPDSGADKLPIRLALPALDEGSHLGYAIQWFSFAVIGIVGWLILLLRKRTP